MASRVTINVNARDMTGRDLDRIRHSFNRLGDDVNRLGGQRTQANMNRLRDSVRQMGGDLDGLRGRIPADEFERLSRRIRDTDSTLRNAHGIPLTDDQMGHLRTNLRGLTDDMRRLGGEGGNIRVRVDPDVDRNRFRSRLMRALTSPIRSLGGFLSGTLSDGVGQGLIGAFKAVGPLGVAVLAAALTTGAALIGAALAGALVLGFGLAFVGLAGYIAVVSGKVTKQWDKVQERLKVQFKDAAQPMIPVLEHGISLVEKLGTSFAPHFKESIATAAPALKTFLDSIAKGITEFGKRAFGPMMKGFDTFMLAFGPEFEKFLQGLGDAFGNLGRTAQKHSGELAMALRMVLGLITTIIDIVNFFANVWAGALRVITFSWGMLLSAFANAVEIMLFGFGAILKGAVSAFGWIPGIGGKLKGALAAFETFGGGTVEQLRRMAQDSKNWGLSMDRANKKRRLEVDISSLQARLKVARSDLQRTSDKKTKAKVQANIDQLVAQIRRARQQLNDLNGKTATTYVKTVKLGGGGLYNNKPVPAQAHGGVVGKAASGGIRNNMTLVGEHGPEIVDLPVGSHVRSNPDTRRTLRGGGGSSEPAVLRIDAASDDLSQLLLKVLRRAIRVQGGNVQVVLGKGSV
jgi:hypothetical protein